MKMGLFFKTTLFAVFFLSLVSQSCPNLILSLKTNYFKDINLCQFHDEYRSQLKWGKYKFNNPEKIANVIAPRFINYPDWIKKRNAYLDPAREIYQPAPLTWNQWMVAADRLDAMASSNFNEQKIKLISFDWLLKLHQLSLQGLTQFPGKIRTLTEYGLALNAKDALTKKQIQGVNSFSLDSNSQPMISFHPLKCFENQKESVINKYTEVNGVSLPFDPNDWESVEKNTFFTDSEGIEKQCGYITYLDPKLVNVELEKWMNYVNETLSAINEHRLNEDFF